MRFTSTFFLPVLLAGLLTTGCGGSSDPAKDMQNGDFSAAAEGYAKRAAAATPGSPEQIADLVDQCTALAHTDPEKAKAVFLPLLEANQVEPEEISLVVGALAGERAFTPAIDLLAIAGERYPESPKMQALYAAVKAKAEKAADPAVMDALKSLPYAGGD